MDEWVIRRATSEDASALAKVNIESWRAAFDGLVRDEFLAGMSLDAQSRRFTSQIERGPAVEVWIAEDNAGVVGYGSLGPERSCDPVMGTEELYALYVRPAFWRQGVGRRLHDQLLDRFAVRDAKQASLWVLEINTRARAFNRALGWSDRGERSEIDLGGDHQAMVRYDRSIL